MSVSTADIVALLPKLLRALERRLCIARRPRLADARPLVLDAVEALGVLAR